MIVALARKLLIALWRLASLLVRFPLASYCDQHEGENGATTDYSEPDEQNIVGIR